MSIAADINGYVTQGRTILGTAEAVSNLFGVSIADAIGINDADQSRISGPAGGFNISNFRAQVGMVGVMKPTLFLTEFSIPPIMRRMYATDKSREVILYTDGLSLPGASWQTSDNIRHWGYGPYESRPYNVQIQDINFSYMIDGRGEIHRFFVNWMNSIVNFNRSNGMNSVAITDAAPYEVSYKKEYSTDIRIFVYDEGTNKILTCTLKDAFPISVDPIPLNWSATDEIAKLPVTMKFVDWYTDSLEFAQITDGFSEGLSFFQKLEKGISVAQTIASLSRPQSIGDIINVINNASIIKSGIADLF